MIHPCDGIFPLVDALGFIFWSSWLFLLQKLHSVPLVLQLCLIALPKLQEQRHYSRKRTGNSTGLCPTQTFPIIIKSSGSLWIKLSTFFLVDD